MQRRIIFIIFSVFFLANFAIGQDTLAGNYDNLKIATGAHVIKEVIRVKGSFEVAAGAKIEFIDAGMIVCEGSITIKGVQNNIEFFGKKNLEGVGILIKNIDSSKVVINNATFRNLQLPLLFDFGWKRDNVEISDNIFSNNIGKISVLQVLNPPFNFNTDSASISFKVVNNLFTGNNAGIYFEDLRSDHVDIEISNNTFANNLVFGFKNYNISTNYIYGRADQVNTRYSSKIENNSFVKNFLVDNISDTIVHSANFGIYGSEKLFNIANNYWGSVTKDIITKGFYDQSINYSSPKLEYEPFLSVPKENNPAHIYSMKNGDNSTEFQDTLTIRDQLKSVILVSNKKVNYSKATINYSYFKKDSTMERIDTLLTFSPQDINATTSKLDITKTVASQRRIGYYTIKGITGSNNEIVPDIRIGYQAFLLDYRKHKLFVDSLKMKKDTVAPKPKELDSVKNQFQKLEAPQKSRIELGLLAGGTIFTGTISNPSLLNNEMNILFGLNINYTMYSNLSASLTIMSSKLSNADYNSSNNEQLARGMSFSTSILGISPALNFDFVDNRLYTKARRFRPSIGVGFDFISFTPTSLFKNKIYNLQPLGTGGQLIDSLKAPYSTLALGYFLNLKLKYQINRFNSVGLFFTIHKSLSDYLDDVGPDEYPTVSSILANGKKYPDAEAAAAAVYFSNPTARAISPGQLRSSPNTSKDGFINFGFFYARKLFK